MHQAASNRQQASGQATCQGRTINTNQPNKTNTCDNGPGAKQQIQTTNKTHLRHAFPGDRNSRLNANGTVNNSVKLPAIPAGYWIIQCIGDEACGVEPNRQVDIAGTGAAASYPPSRQISGSFSALAMRPLTWNLTARSTLQVPGQHQATRHPGRSLGHSVH